MIALAQWWLAAAATLALAAPAAPVGAAEVRALYQGNKPPFSFTDAQGRLGGIEIDLVVEAFRRTGHAVAFHEAPNVRLLPLPDEGVDIAVSVRGADGAGTYFSDQFVVYENVAVSRKDKQIALNSIADLDRHRFAIWQNGWRDLGPAFEARYRPDASGRFPRNYVQPLNQKSQNLMFWLGRVDVIVVDKTLFGWYRKQLAAQVDTSAEVDYHPIFTGATGFQVAFRQRALRDAFNAALKAMRQDGTYEAIMARYRGLAPGAAAAPAGADAGNRR